MVFWALKVNWTILQSWNKSWALIEASQSGTEYNNIISIRECSSKQTKNSNIASKTGLVQYNNLRSDSIYSVNNMGDKIPGE
jgi:hypothetical protein